ncbi:hypothetical protein K501DRAFT_200688 [Backusella circina FSU 941]|nr:hypothetical protein K501DRAFT_200688 [Backusella circina FSU 941]
MKLYNILSKFDCIACDGGYNLFIKKLEEICKQKHGLNKKYVILNDNNFVYPIRKDIGIELTSTEDRFNKTFGSFRSGIENQFLF